MRLLFLFGLLGSCALLTVSCVSYNADPLVREEMGDEIAQLQPGTLDFEGALAFARLHNPELKKLRAEAEAAGFDVPATSINITANTLEQKALGFFDPIAIAKMGPRGARAEAAKEREAALVAKLAGRDLDIAADIAQVFLVERVLAALALPEISADPAQFEKAGLASAVDRQRVEYARARGEAEAVTVACMRRENRAEYRRLLGVRSTAAIGFILPEGEFPPLPAQNDLRLRPDLAVALARYRVADREFRAAVLDQYPVVSIGPVFNWDLVSWGLFLPTRIPVGAAGPARAAGKRREAARMAVADTFLRAEEDGESSRARFERTASESTAAAIGAQAAAADLRFALVHLEVTPDAFPHLSRSAPEAVERMIRARVAEIAAVEARVAYARAYAWPTSEEVSHEQG